MNALFLVLNDVYMLDDIYEILYEAGVGATTFDSIGMGKVLLQHHVDVPIFSSIKKIVEGEKAYNKTIISVIRDETILRDVIDKINKKLDYIAKPGIGFMFVVPVSECYGNKVEEDKID